MVGASLNTGGVSIPVTGLAAWIILIGAIAGALGFVIALYERVTKSGPYKWVFRKLIREPLTAYLNHIIDGQMAPITAQLTPNGGSSLVDKISKISITQDEQVNRLKALEDRMTEVRHDVVDVKGIGNLTMALGTVPTIAGALEKIVGDLGRLEQAISKSPPAVT